MAIKPTFTISQTKERSIEMRLTKKSWILIFGVVLFGFLISMPLWAPQLIAKTKLQFSQAQACGYLETTSFGITPIPDTLGCGWVKLLPDSIEILQARPGSTHQVDAYRYIKTLDDQIAPIPYSQPNQSEYMKKKFTPYRKAVPAIEVSATIGSHAVIPEWHWVKMVNKEAITQRFSNGNGLLYYGDTCGVEFGGEITVLKIQGENLLVNYSPPGEPMGTPCPKNTRFIVSTADFATMTERYWQIRSAKIADMKLVTTLLNQHYFGEVVNAGNWRWVDVVNIEPIRQEFANGWDYLSYGDTCGIDGTSQVRGMSDKKVLYEYTATGYPMGTACPSGVLFWALLEKDHEQQ